MGLTSFNNFVVLCAAEDDPTENNVPYDAVEAILTDGEADIVYQDFTDVQIVPTGEMVGGDTVRGSNDGKRQQFIKQMSNVTVEGKLRAFPDSGTLPRYHPILRAANIDLSIDNDDVVGFKKTKQVAACTIYKFYRQIYDDNWRLRVATGVVGSLTINIDVDQEPTFSFEGTGQYFDLEAPAEFFDPANGQIALLKDGSTAITARTTGEFIQDNQEPMTCTNMTVSANDGDGFDDPILLQTMELNLNFDVADLTPVQGATTRRRGVLTRGRGAATEGSADVVDYTDAVINEIIDGVTATPSKEYALTVEFGNSQGTVELFAPKMQFMREEESDNSGVVQYAFPFRLNGDWEERLLPDNELRITYSPAPA